MAAGGESGADAESEAGGVAQPRFETLRRRAFSIPALVSLLVAGGFLVFLVTRFDVDINATWSQVRGADPWLLIAAFAVHYTTFLFRGARWRLLLQHSARTGEVGASVPGVLYCSQLVLLGWFVNSIGWLRLGDAFRAYVYQDEHGATFFGSIGTILAERVLDTVLVALMLVVTVPFIVGVGSGGTWTVLLVAIGLAVGLLVLLSVMVWAEGPLMRRLPTWLAIRYHRFHAGAMGTLHGLPKTTALGLLGWLAEVGRMYLVTVALGLELGIAVVVFLTLANSLLSLVPTPGGVGAVESGVAGLAVRLASLVKEAATALVLVDRFITYISVILLGAVIFAVRPAFRRRRGAPPVAPVDETSPKNITDGGLREG